MNWHWPDNKRMALCLSFDIDAETLWLTRNEINARHLANMSRGLYATKQGLPRILRLLAEEGLKATFFTTAYTAEIHPEIIQYIAAQGHEIGYHGYLHEVKDTYEEESALMDKVDAIFRKLTGKRPVGVRMPDGIIHDFHKRLWLERGIIYSSNWRNNDGPFLLDLDGGEIPIVELPKDGVVDDTSYDMYTLQHPEHYYLRSGREMVKIWQDEIDGLAEEGRMLNLVMHPQFIGRPGYVRALRGFLRYAAANGVWIATDEQVARHVLAQKGYNIEVKY
ncbi:polysaccharide deacetylase [uncultured Phascolarctobacterium sp.]|uniref:polysaccharide deacetylase family protein n=1 Tax=uncultured Phascolarctobacterium sp. TaxID=512296 RepID=UPI0025DDA296|nr:polysaccharide deacetylase [uncultured Phascolarctobacterium sp.]